MSKDITENLIQDIENYMRLKISLDKVRPEEMKMRKILVSKLKEYCETIDIDLEDDKIDLNIDDVFHVKVKEGVNISIDQDYLSNVYDDLDPEIQDCFVPTFKLNTRNYNALKKKLDDSGEDSDLFSIVTEKEGAPTIDVKLLAI